MGIDPIGYKPWKGKRAGYYERIFVISTTMFRQKLKSKWILLLLILGMMLVYIFPIITFSLVPHLSILQDISFVGGSTHQMTRG